MAGPPTPICLTWQGPRGPGRQHSPWVRAQPDPGRRGSGSRLREWKIRQRSWSRPRRAGLLGAGGLRSAPLCARPRPRPGGGGGVPGRRRAGGLPAGGGGRAGGGGGARLCCWGSGSAACQGRAAEPVLCLTPSSPATKQRPRPLGYAPPNGWSRCPRRVGQGRRGQVSSARAE